LVKKLENPVIVGVKHAATTCRDNLDNIEKH